MRTFETIIIGAGPGGLACATRLARHGRQVLVLERRPQVGPKVCAGGIPHHALEELGLPPELREAEFPLQVIRTPWQQARVRFEQPVITTINRQRLGGWQLQQALGAGVEVRTDSPVTAVGDGWVEGANGERLGYRHLVGADGAASLVRRRLGLASRRLGVGINHQVPGRWPDMEWHLDPGLFGNGYAWIFPHRETTSIGAYADRAELGALELAARLHRWAQGLGIGLGQTRARAALINFDYQGWDFRPLFLTGDAAGLASGFTGEGIYPAIVSGEAAASAILDPAFQPVRLTRLIRRQRLHHRLQKLLATHKLICQISLEMLVLAIRAKIIGFEALEMY